ncbi:MAG: hypothetical protein PSX79_07855 [bacterium]|nr:hypothetical protein [bacterium]
MRVSLAVLAISFALAAAPVRAAPIVAAVRVTIGSELAKKTEILDAREFEYLTGELKRSVEKTLQRSGTLRPDGGALDLVIEDARPNRPTLREMSAKPGLSYSSFGVGGARIGGEYRAKSGVRTPVHYSWYETDIRWADTSSTWSDAGRAFDKLADRLDKDQLDDR